MKLWSRTLKGDDKLYIIDKIDYRVKKDDVDGE